MRAFPVCLSVQITKDTEPRCFVRLYSYLLKPISICSDLLVQTHGPRKLHLLTEERTARRESSIVFLSNTLWYHQTRHRTLLRLLKTTRGDRYLVHRQLQSITYRWVTTATLAWCNERLGQQDVIDNYTGQVVRSSIDFWFLGLLNSNLRIDHNI